MNFKKFYFAVLFIFISLAAFSQTDTIGLKTIIAKSAKLSNDHPVEKVYLHFDKPYYAVNDTVWFKAYVTVDVHQPSPLSKIVYVDVISSKDSIVQTLKLQVSGSTALGNVTLFSPLYKQGNYRFRAYTNWMRNDDPAYFFNKTIAVGSFNNPIITTISLSGATKNNVSKVAAKVQFRDPTGKPYVNKKVSWKALNDDETIGKGKGVTDNNGILNVAISTNKTTGLISSDLVTTIDVTDDKSINNSFSLKHAVDQPDVQFFPEGGELVSGILSKVAFKVVKPDGLGLDIKGTITDNSGTVVANLTSQHLGMGVFNLQPSADKTYKANITFPDGSQEVYDLPKVQTEGITLSVINTDPVNLTVKLLANPAFFQKNQNKLFYIIAQTGEIIFFAAQTPLSTNIYSAPIPKSKFPSGVLKLTLFSDHGEPLAERIVFIKKDDLLNLTMKTAQPSYATRQKVAVNVTAQNMGKPAEADLSVTVIDETKVPYDESNETTILTNLLLTSELKGYIEKPNYYFIHPDEKTAADMDVLMLTQGYRRFSYKDIIANKFPQNKYLPEQGITISGTIRNGTGLPIPRGNLSLIVPTRLNPINTVANASGEFKFTNLLFPDSTKVTINAKNNPNSNYLMILLDNETSQGITPNITAPDGITNIDSTLSAYLQNSKQQFTNSHTLKEVVIQATSLEKKPSHEDYPALSGLGMQADHFISGEHLNACTFLSQCLQTSAFGLVYENNNLYVLRSYNAGDKRAIQIYVDGLSVDFNYLSTITAETVESVEVFLNDGMSGINRMNNTNGVLVVNLKKIKKVKMSKEDIRAMLMPQNSAVNTFFRGYTQARVFYSPKYDPAKAAPSKGSDLRSTIYWNPKVETDKSGVGSFEFFNADTKGSYRAIIEGIDSNGNIGRYIYHYTVQ